MTKKSNIYTRRGDSGTTSLASGERVEKTHPRIEAYGTIDELTAHIGVLSVVAREREQEFQRIQMQLCTICAILATGDEAQPLAAPPSDEEVGWLEALIDEIDSQLPPLRSFVIPGGNMAAAQAHVCRTVCRRAERRIHSIDSVPENVLRFMNRLSDYFFVLSRIFLLHGRVDEIKWNNSCG